MGMSKAARMMMMNRSDDHYDKHDDYDRKERDRYYDHRDKYRDYKKDHDYGKEIRAGGTFWMDDGKREEHEFDRKSAEHWVSRMDNPESGKGGKWTYDQTAQVMKQKGFNCDAIDFFVAMNSIYSDYGKTLTKHGITSVDVYADLAYDWVKDPDAVKNKSSAYYNYIFDGK